MHEDLMRAAIACEGILGKRVHCQGIVKSMTTRSIAVNKLILPPAQLYPIPSLCMTVRFDVSMRLLFY